MLPATTTYTGWSKPVLLSSIGTDEAGFWNSKVMIKKGDKIAEKNAAENTAEAGLLKKMVMDNRTATNLLYS